VRTFHVLAALFAAIVLARHARSALALLAPRSAAPGVGRLSGLAPLLACLAAAAVLAMAARALLVGHLDPGAAP
jgi:hypothetical protein